MSNVKSTASEMYVQYTKRFSYTGVAQGGGRGEGGHLSKVGGGHKWVCAPPPLLDRPNVLNSLFSHILWLKHNFFKNFLGSLRLPILIIQYFPNFTNLKF